MKNQYIKIIIKKINIGRTKELKKEEILLIILELLMKQKKVQLKTIIIMLNLKNKFFLNFNESNVNNYNYNKYSILILDVKHNL